MTDAGPNTREMQALVQRRRGAVVGIICSAIEESMLPHHDQNQLKVLVKDAVNSFADGICNLLPSVVDESVPVSALYLEFIERIANDVGEMKAAMGLAADGPIPVATDG